MTESQWNDLYLHRNFAGSKNITQGASMSTPETELKSAEASLAATKAVIEGDALKVETEVKTLWARYDFWIALAITAIICLNVGYHLHK